MIHSRLGSCALGLAAPALLVAAAGCASDDSARRAVAEVSAMHARVDEAQASGQANAREVAALESRLRTLEGETVRLGRELRSATLEQERMRAALAHVEPSARPPVTAGSAALVAPPTAAPSAAVPGAPAPAVEPPPAVAGVVPPPARAASAVTPRPAAAPAGGAAAEKTFAGALANVRAGEPGQAVLEFTDFIARFPDHPRAATAQWWIGEAYYRQRDFRQALAEFQRVVEAYPKAPVVPDALLRIGLCHRALDDATRAGEALQRVMREFPASDAAARARAALAARGGGRGSR